MHFLRRILLVGALVVAVGPFAHAQNRSGNDPLRGLRKVTVLVERLDSGALRSGLTEERLRTIVELKLRMLGIRVLTKAEDDADSDLNPYVYLNLNVMPMNDEARYVFSVDLDVRTDVNSPHNGVLIKGLIWSKGGIAGAGRQAMPSYAEQYVAEIADSLANDWLKANPR